MPNRSPRVAIAGGGPAGAAVACLLARAGFAVSVFESSARQRDRIGETLPPSATGLLQRMGLYSAGFAERHAASYGVRCAWGGEAPEDRDFLREPHGPGWVVDRAIFERDLTDFARTSGADWQTGSTLRRPCWQDGQWWFTVHRGGKDAVCQADFLIDATGRRRAIARSLSVPEVAHDDLVGIARTFAPTLECVPEKLTLIEAVPAGWWYSAVLPGGRLMIVFFTDRDLPSSGQARSPRGFCELLRQTHLTRQRLCAGRYRALSQIRTLAAGTTELSAAAGPRWLAVGDAAGALDPLTAHGIVAALGSAYYAACAVIDGQPLIYAELLQNVYAGYRTALRQYYALERRWPHEPFWMRRHK